MTTKAPFLVRHASVIFSLKTFAAAVLALLLAMWMDLPRPYWAMATVYIASQPLSGATRSKAFYRVGGTIIGAIAAVAMVPVFVNAPELLCLAIALWVGACLYISLLDRSARSYLFMLSGYTAALIAFPVVSEPATTFDTALSRVEEITLGIICASLVATIVLPRAVGPAVAARIDGWLHEARSLTQHILAGNTADRPTRDRRLKLAADAVDIELLADHLAYDPGRGRASAESLRLVRRHMLALLPLLSSIADRLESLGPDLRENHPQLARLIDDVNAWLTTDDPDRAPADALRAAIKAQEPELDAHSSWDDILLLSLLLRLRELVDVSHDCRMLQERVATGKPVSTAALAFRPEAGVASARHRDHGMALWSAAAAIAATLICCVFWIGTGWADGASAPLMAAIGCCFFAGQDDPAPGIRGFAIWSVVAMVLDAFYLFAALPMISNVEILILALAPALLLFGVLIARPATSFVGMVLAANSISLLALQNSYNADFASFANSSISFVIGIVVAVAFTKLARSVGAEWSARRLLKTSWITLAVAAERRGKRDRAQFAGLMLHRIGLLAPRLAAIPKSALRDVDNLRELRVGLNIVDLRRARHGLSLVALAAMDAMLDRLAREFRRWGGQPKSDALLAAIDHALAEALNGANDTVRRDALIGLVGIRRGLFPDAPAYVPAPEPAIAMRIAA